MMLTIGVTACVLTLLVASAYYILELRAANRVKRAVVFKELGLSPSTRIIGFFHPYWYVPLFSLVISHPA